MMKYVVIRNVEDVINEDLYNTNVEIFSNEENSLRCLEDWYNWDKENFDDEDEEIEYEKKYDNYYEIGSVCKYNRDERYIIRCSIKKVEEKD